MVGQSLFLDRFMFLLMNSFWWWWLGGLADALIPQCHLEHTLHFNCNALNRPDNQLFVCTTIVWEVPTVHGNKLRCIGLKHPPKSNYLCRASVVAIIFNVFSFDASSDRDSNLSPLCRRADALRVEQQLRVIMNNFFYFLQYNWCNK